MEDGQRRLQQGTSAVEQHRGGNPNVVLRYLTEDWISSEREGCHYPSW